MRRADLLILTGMSEQSFSALAHRKALPFSRKAGESRAWTNYSASDLLRLDLALTYARHGATQVQAAALVRGGFEDLAGIALRTRSKDDIYLGIVTFGDREEEEEEEEEEEGSTWTVPFAGSIAALQRQIQTQVRDTGDAPHHLIVINVSQRLRLLKARARQQPNGSDLLLELDNVWQGAVA